MRILVAHQEDSWASFPLEHHLHHLLLFSWPFLTTFIPLLFGWFIFLVALSFVVLSLVALSWPLLSFDHPFSCSKAQSQEIAPFDIATFSQRKS
jgi:hypothetical protein